MFITCFNLVSKYCFDNRGGGLRVSPKFTQGQTTNTWIFYVNLKGERLTDGWFESVWVCVCERQTNRLIQRQRGGVYEWRPSTCACSVYVCVGGGGGVCGCTPLYLRLSHQLWNAIAYISNMRSCLFGRVSSSFPTLKQFLLSCDRWRDSVISVILCVGHLNCAFKAKRLWPSNRSTNMIARQPHQPTQKCHYVGSVILFDAGFSKTNHE